MGKIPEDAIHWDSGDWIDWHRSADGLDEGPCGAAAEEDTLARLTALHVNLLRAAKTYHVVSGDHLPVYPAIAEVYAAIHFDLPMRAADRKNGPVKLLHIPPLGPNTTVEVNLADDFDLLIVVRIKDSFAVEARTLPRDALPAKSKGLHTLSWKSMPSHR